MLLLRSWYLMLIFCCVKVSSSSEDCQHQCLMSKTCKAKKFADTCYYIFPGKKQTWRESKELCGSEGLAMAKIEKIAIEQNFTIKDLVGDQQNLLVWLGGRTYNFPKWSFNHISPKGTSSDGTLEFHDGAGELQCGILQIPNSHGGNFIFGIEQDGCNKSRKFICRFGEWHNTPSIYLSELKTTWPEAQSRCANSGGNLLYLKPTDAIQPMEHKLKHFPDETFYVAPNFKSWRWDDGSEILHYNWLRGAPNASDKTCLMMYSWTAKWQATFCDGALYAFCQNDNIETQAPVLIEVEATNHTSSPALTMAIGLGIFASLHVLVVTVAVIVCRPRNCTCLNMMRQRLPAGNVVDNNSYTYIEIQGVMPTEREDGNTPRNSGTANDADEEGLVLEEGAIANTTENDDNDHTAQCHSDQMGSGGSGRTGEQTMHVALDNLDNSDYLVPVSGTEHIVSVPNEPSPADSGDMNTEIQVPDINHGAEHNMAAIASGDENEYTSLTPKESRDKENCSRESPYIPLSSRRHLADML